MEQIKAHLTKIDALTSKTLKKAVKEPAPSKLYVRTKTIASKTKNALEKMEQCEMLLEKRKTLRSTNSIEKIKTQTLEEFQVLYDVVKKISRLIK
jgi:hypothetical protein